MWGAPQYQSYSVVDTDTKDDIVYNNDDWPVSMAYTYFQQQTISCSQTASRMKNHSSVCMSVNDINTYVMMYGAECIHNVNVYVMGVKGLTTNAIN